MTLSEIKAWRASLDPKTESTNAAAYRLLRSILQAAEEEELIDRAPPKIRGAGRRRKQVAKPATFDELAVIIDAMPERLKLLIVLAAFVGLREGELLELRRSDVDGVTGRITSPAKSTRTSTRRRRCVPRLRPSDQRSEDRERHTNRPRPAAVPANAPEASARAHRPRPDGLLFPGDRTDHMSVRYLMDRYRPAREAAGRPDLTIHHLRHTALTLAGQHGATAAELQARAATPPRPRWRSTSTQRSTATGRSRRRSVRRTRPGPTMVPDVDRAGYPPGLSVSVLFRPHTRASKNHRVTCGFPKSGARSRTSSGSEGLHVDDWRVPPLRGAPHRWICPAPPRCALCEYR